VPTYRYRRADEAEAVEIVAASYEVTSGVAVFRDVTEENGARLVRTVEVRRVRLAGCAEAPEPLAAPKGESRVEAMTRA